jgi:hypothetical protein
MSRRSEEDCGKSHVVTDDYVSRLIHEQEILDGILKTLVAFITDESGDRVGLPGGSTDEPEPDTTDEQQSSD